MQRFSFSLNQFTDKKSTPLFFDRTKRSSFFKPVIQPKLSINKHNDIHEQEADATADKIMHMSTNEQPFFSLKPLSISRLQRKCQHCEEEEKLQRKETNSEATIEDATTENYIGSLNGKGYSLSQSERSFFEPRFGYDFSNVQLHTNEEASQSAKHVNALAYTHSNNIVFGSNFYQPSTDSGKRLIAHELTHVVQQGCIRRMRNDNSIVQRQTPGEMQPSVDNETLIRNWLNSHQFEPPENQPAEGENHVLLNVEDMLLTRAVQLAAADLNQPQETVRRVITALLLPRRPIRSLLLDPVIGPGKLAPGIPSSSVGPTLTGGIDPVIGKIIDLETIDRWLEEHHFRPPEIRDPTGDTVVLDGQNTTIEAVANRALAIAGGWVSFLTLDDVLIHLRRLYVAARGGPGTQIVFGYTLIPRTSQFIVPADTLHTQHQFSFTITRAHHAGDSPGLESSFQGSVSLSEAGEILNVQAGGQEAVVAPLLRGWIQVSALVQTMVAANWNTSASGTATISPSIQLAGGGQALITPNFRGGPFSFINGHVQVGVQALVGVQATPQGVQAVGSVGFVVNIPFNIL